MRLLCKKPFLLFKKMITFTYRKISGGILMKFVADLHTHTNVCHHAFSSLEEMCRAAHEKGLKVLGMTDHGPKMTDGCHPWHFASAVGNLPRIINGVYVLRGIEADITSPKGALDLEDEYLAKLDYVVASLHRDVIQPSTIGELTCIMENVIHNPYVTILGHMGDPIFNFDYEYIISQCNKYDKVVELNSNSPFSRIGSEKNCHKIAALCKKYSVPIVCNSDAHFSGKVGDLEHALSVARDVDFPEELILNSSLERLKKFFKEKKGLEIDIE